MPVKNLPEFQEPFLTRASRLRHALLLFQESLDLESLLEPWNRSAGKPIINPLSADAKLSG